MADIAVAVLVTIDVDGHVEHLSVPPAVAESMRAAYLGRRAGEPAANDALLSLAAEFERRAENCALSAEACRAVGEDRAASLTGAVGEAFGTAARMARHAAGEPDSSRHAEPSRGMAAERPQVHGEPFPAPGPVPQDPGTGSVGLSAVQGDA